MIRERLEEHEFFSVSIRGPHIHGHQQLDFVARLTLTVLCHAQTVEREQQESISEESKQLEKLANKRSLLLNKVCQPSTPHAHAHAHAQGLSCHGRS